MAPITEYPFHPLQEKLVGKAPPGAIAARLLGGTTPGRPPVPHVLFQNPETGVPRVRSGELEPEAPARGGELLVDRKTSGLAIEGNRADATIMRHRTDTGTYSLLFIYSSRKDALRSDDLYRSFEIARREGASEEIGKMKALLGPSISLLALIVVTVVPTALIVGLGITSDRTPGRTPGPPYSPLPPTGGWPESTLRLEGVLTCDNGIYRLEVSALPGYVVPLRFIAPDLEREAQSHLREHIIVTGYWDKTEPSIFLVESVLKQP